ncbi:GNAT family N-acetyltransferase [Nakamurella sp. YIM 132087]|uniref:GNAT family N-acetyltransferase n=1 Tax=Nakamurella alba TaxID=2665158 RepID=A0A7K1FS66_9ACTN|nr:GNAT family N-acetyltransferase [Nakamurella alba]MTD16982.1 GNAT family N-acetyltransferase [Nakamurella alba]
MSTVGPRVPGTRIRDGRENDLPALGRIEDAAGELFRTVGMDAIADDPSPTPSALRPFLADGRLAVATIGGDRPVGYLTLEIVDGAAHVAQLSVDPAVGRRGLGTALLDHAARWALARDLHTLTLTTFRDVPWNAPYYRARGFVDLPDDARGPELTAIVAGEAAHGLAAWPRVCQIHRL